MSLQSENLGISLVLHLKSKHPQWKWNCYIGRNRTKFTHLNSQNQVRFLSFNPLTPWSDQHLISPYIIMYSYLTSVWLLTALGPDHMAVYVSPASDVDLLTSSLGPLLPIQDGGDRVVYFIYYSHCTDVGPWELLLELLVRWTITVFIIPVINKIRLPLHGRLIL